MKVEYKGETFETQHYVEVSDEFSNYNVEENYEISDYEEDNIDESITYYVEDENAQDIQNRLQSWNFQREDNKKIA